MGVDAIYSEPHNRIGVIWKMYSKKFCTRKAVEAIKRINVHLWSSAPKRVDRPLSRGSFLSPFSSVPIKEHRLEIQKYSATNRRVQPESGEGVQKRSFTGDFGKVNAGNATHQNVLNQLHEKRRIIIRTTKAVQNESPDNGS